MIEIVLPWPNAKLWPNRSNGQHWAKTAAIRAKAKADAYYLAKQALGAFKVPAGYIPISLIFQTPDARRRDVDGCLSSFKASLDGIAAALGVDDSVFRPILIDWRSGPKDGAVLVHVRAEISFALELA